MTFRTSPLAESLRTSGPLPITRERVLSVMKVIDMIRDPRHKAGRSLPEGVRATRWHIVPTTGTASNSRSPNRTLILS